MEMNFKGKLIKLTNSINDVILKIISQIALVQIYSLGNQMPLMNWTSSANI